MSRARAAVRANPSPRAGHKARAALNERAARAATGRDASVTPDGNVPEFCPEGYAVVAVFGPQPAVVQVGDGFCNGQSQAVAALCARPVGTVEAVEQVRERIWRNGTTNVVYGKADTGLFFCQGHGDGAVLHCVFDRVVHENGDELAQLCGVAGQDDVGFNARRIEPNAFFIGERFKRQADAVYKVAYTLKSALLSHWYLEISPGIPSEPVVSAFCFLHPGSAGTRVRPASRSF